MSEPITEVWRVSGGMAAANGLYDREEVAQAQHALNQSAGFKSASLERLPLATPEMVRVIGAAARVAAWEANADDDSAIRALSESNLSLGTLLHEVLMLSMAIDAARAAGGAHA